MTPKVNKVWCNGTKANPHSEGSDHKGQKNKASASDSTAIVKATRERVSLAKLGGNAQTLNKTRNLNRDMEAPREVEAHCDSETVGAALEGEERAVDHSVAG